MEKYNSLLFWLTLYTVSVNCRNASDILRFRIINIVLFQKYPRNITVPQIRPQADIVHFKYARTYLLTYLLTMFRLQTL